MWAVSLDETCRPIYIVMVACRADTLIALYENTLSKLVANEKDANECVTLDHLLCYWEE